MKAEISFKGKMEKVFAWFTAFFILFLPFCVSYAEKREDILLDVPFLSQAPTFKWSDDRFASACEEASMVMALAWAGIQPIGKTGKEQAQTILDLVEFEKKKYNVYFDTSPRDTIRFAREYSGYTGFNLRHAIRASDILRQLEQGFLVIASADGRVLKNPNFTGLGPTEHMLVIRGYDYDTQEFITNDPGTRFGEGYRYARKVLFSAIRDYKTGHKEKGRPRTKSMIIIEKKKEAHYTN